MKKLLLLFILSVSLLSCEIQAPQKQVEKFSDCRLPTTINSMKIEQISEEVPHGLFKIRLEDSTEILLYRGVESCTMIKIK